VQILYDVSGRLGLIPISSGLQVVKDPFNNSLTLKIEYQASDVSYARPSTGKASKLLFNIPHSKSGAWDLSCPVMPIKDQGYKLLGFKPGSSLPWH